MKIEYDFWQNWIINSDDFVFTLIKISFSKDVYGNNEIGILFCFFNFWLDITFDFEMIKK